MLRPNGEPTDRKWERWKLKAAAEGAAALAVFGSTGGYSVKPALYRECRAEIIRHFSNKCGYCEDLVVNTIIRRPDLDHYRPSNGVKEFPSRAEVLDSHGRPHPGYYWLAYHWANLLPACPSCNRPGNVGGTVGKWDFFPISGTRAFGPIADIDDYERPQILNPWVDDPRAHLKFDFELGIIAGRTKRGKATVKILDLNRDGLITGRQEALELARVAVADYAQAIIRRHRHANDSLAKALEHALPSKTFSAFRSAFVVPYLAALAKASNNSGRTARRHRT